MMEKQAAVASAAPAGFIQADAANFKDLVQRLTGARGGAAHKLRPNATTPFKLQERRKQSLGDLEIIKPGVKSAGKSPVKGPMTPLGCETVGRERVGTESPPSEEERAIAEKGFYLHASPAKADPPVLLTLFPLTPVGAAIFVAPNRAVAASKQHDLFVEHREPKRRVVGHAPGEIERVPFFTPVVLGRFRTTDSFFIVNHALISRRR